MRTIPFPPYFLMVALASSLAFTGCGGESPSPTAPGNGAPVEVDGGTETPDQQTGAPEAASGDPVEGDWIVVRLSAETSTLNTYLDAADAYTQRVVDGNGGNIFETLIVRDNETLEYKPHIAARWEISDDHLTYTFYLKEGVTFSDGEPLTAHDLLFTYNVIMNPENDCARTRSYLIDFETAELLDDYTIRFAASKPYFQHLEVLGTLHILPEHIYSKGDFNKDFSRNPVGSGPFRFKQWDTGQQIVLVKRDDYWGDKKPWVNEIHFKMVTDDNAAIQLVRRQEVDEMVMQPEQWVRQASKPDITDHFQRITLYSPMDGYAGSFNWIGWNTRRPYFSDKRVRRAMTMLLNRELIGETIYHGLVRVVTGSMFPDAKTYDQSIEPWPYDPDRAKQLLDEAGWIDSDQDGIRDKDGQRFQFEWIIPSGSAEYERLATVYKEQLDKVGIDVTLRPLEWATFSESVKDRSFDACIMSWASPLESDPYQIWHSSQTEKGSNYVGFVSEEADQIIEQARLEFDSDKRAAMYRRFHAILHEEQPYTFLYNRKRTVAVSNRFQNVKRYPLGFDMREWWVPVDQQRYK